MKRKQDEMITEINRPLAIYKQFMDLLNRTSSTYSKICSTWHHEDLKNYCHKNIELKNQYEYISNLLTKTQQNKQVLKNELQNAAYKQLQIHFEDMERQPNEKLIEDNDKQIPQQSTKPVPSSEVLDRAQATFFQTKLTKGPEEVSKNRQDNQALSEILKQKEREIQELKSSINKITEYTERKIVLSDKEYEVFTALNAEFIRKINNYNNPKEVLDIWDKSRLLKLSHFGNAFSSSKLQYFTISKKTLISFVTNILQDPRLFRIVYEIIEANPEFYQFLFGTLGIEGRKNTEQTTLDCYKLQDNLELVINLLIALSAIPSTSVEGNRVKEYVTQSNTLKGLIQNNLNNPKFVEIADKIIKIVPNMKPVKNAFTVTPNAF